MTPFKRGKDNCVQDNNENCPFASTGGLDKRTEMTVPEYIKPEEAEEYICGYQRQAELMYGIHWRDAQFRWLPALVIGGKS